MSKRFAIIGSGWRAEFYIRIAQHPDNDFVLTGLLCRTEEKRRALSEKYGICPTLSEEEIAAGKPDFVVVAVSKPSLSQVAAHWQQLGFAVLCETPAAVSEEDLRAIYARSLQGGAPLLIAEQYQDYDTYRRMLDIVRSGRIGQPVSASVSLAHEYHGASLLRQALLESGSSGFRMCVRKYELPVTKTGDRYHIYTDGEMIRRFRTVALLEFDNGKIAQYDFDSEQYHSVIRHNRIHITGTRGEIMNEMLWYLDGENRMHEERWTEDIQAVRAPGANGQLSQDENAIACMMELTFRASREDCPEARENLYNALTDAYFMLLLQSGTVGWFRPQVMPWMQ